MTDVLMTIGTVITPIAVFILSGYYASNQKWCDRKVIVSIAVGLILGAYAIYAGQLVSNDWIQVAFNSAPVLGLMYVIDRIIKGAAKRYGIEWLYTDECPIEE
jgi:hypothetical protein